MGAGEIPRSYKSELHKIFTFFSTIVIVVYSCSADGIYGDYGQFRAIIESNGKIHWEPGGIFKTVCEIDITYYPFDEQSCK